MVGRTLREIRDRLAELAAPDGRYVLACGRTGERPVPVAGLRFPDRESAAAATEAASAYRETLRGYDPQVAHHDLLAHDCTEWSGLADGRSPTAATVEFCHGVTGVTFEALATHGYRSVEAAVMDAYLALAETTTDRDELCLLLLGCLLAELDGLSAQAQSEVVRTAAASIPTRTDTPAENDPPRPGAGGTDPATPSAPEAVLRWLRAAAVVSDGRVRTCDRGWRFVFEDYALALGGRRFPTLPLAVGVLGRAGEDGLAFSPAVALDEGGWHLSVRSIDGPDRGLVSVGTVDDDR